MVKGKTKSGIKFQIDERIKEDARFLFYLSLAQKADAGLEKQNEGVQGILRLVFGTDEGVIQFMDAVASVHNGVCGVSEMLGELTEIFEALQAKN